jgi:hypothetical protein
MNPGGSVTLIVVLAAVAGCSGGSSSSTSGNPHLSAPTGNVLLVRSGSGSATFGFSPQGNQRLTYQATCSGGHAVTISSSDLSGLTTYCPAQGGDTIDGKPPAKHMTVHVVATPGVRWQVRIEQNATSPQ